MAIELGPPNPQPEPQPEVASSDATCAKCGKRVSAAEAQDWYVITRASDEVATVCSDDCLARWAAQYSEEKYLTGIARDAFSKAVWKGETETT